MVKKLCQATVILFLVFIASACNSESTQGMEKKTSENNSSQVSSFKVVIDPGHGGHDVGATGASGQYEKDFTLSLSKKVKELLEQETDIEVFMTRADDTHISQESRYRPKYANEINADVFVSIHGNTFADSNVTGTETFYYHKYSKSFAEIIHHHLIQATGFKDRGVKKEEFFVLKDTDMPAVLLEIGYLTNPQDESEMLTDSFQNRVAQAIVDGIKEYRMQS
jgi:N-acetylmuramoyl-L-alanine amidase